MSVLSAIALIRDEHSSERHANALSHAMIVRVWILRIEFRDCDEEREQRSSLSSSSLDLENEFEEKSRWIVHKQLW